MATQPTQQVNTCSMVTAGMIETLRARANSATLDLARHDDKTEWQVLAPPSNDLTRTFVAARPECTALVSVHALGGASAANETRGTAFPFVFDGKMSNGLATVRAHVLGAMAARAVRDALCTAGDAVEFCVDGSVAWHVFMVHRLLDGFTGKGVHGYRAAVSVAAHAGASGVAPLKEAAQAVARACFVNSTDELDAIPSDAMKELVFAACTGEIPAGLAARLFPARARERVAEIEADVVACYPRVADVDVLRMRAPEVAASHDARANNKARALCGLYGINVDGIAFDV